MIVCLFVFSFTLVRYQKNPLEVEGVAEVGGVELEVGAVQDSRQQLEAEGVAGGEAVAGRKPVVEPPMWAPLLPILQSLVLLRFDKSYM